MTVWLVYNGFGYDGQQVVAVYDNEEAANLHVSDGIKNLPPGDWEFWYAEEIELESKYDEKK